MNDSFEGQHTPECSVQHIRECPSGKSLHGEPKDNHWWSGWPGAYCMKCGDDDLTEICLGGCKCPCHDSFWEEYESAMKREEASR